jgi:hypothetical protein
VSSLTDRECHAYTSANKTQTPSNRIIFPYCYYQKQFDGLTTHQRSLRLSALKIPIFLRFQLNKCIGQTRRVSFNTDSSLGLAGRSECYLLAAGVFIFSIF